jgi:hypothetical protein
VVSSNPHIIARRITALHGVPWPIPAVVLLRFTDEDLDDLELAERAGRDAYWLCLNRIVTRVQSGSGRLAR